MSLSPQCKGYIDNDGKYIANNIVEQAKCCLDDCAPFFEYCNKQCGTDTDCLRTCNIQHNICKDICRLISPEFIIGGTYDDCSDKYCNRTRAVNRKTPVPFNKCIVQNQDKIKECCLSSCKENDWCEEYCNFMESQVVEPQRLNSVETFECNLRTPLQEYRLGDFIKIRKSRNNVNIQDQFPNTLAAKYLEQTSDEYNTAVLAKVVSKYPVAHSDCIVLHLRVGDVIDGERYSPEELVEKARFITRFPLLDRTNYVPSWPNIRKQLDKTGENKNITIVAGVHYDSNGNKKSCKYIQLIKKHLEDEGYNVTLQLGGHPDEDFAQMCNASILITSGGGFGELSRKVRTHLNNGPSYDSSEKNSQNIWGVPIATIVILFILLISSILISKLIFRG